MSTATTHPFRFAVQSYRAETAEEWRTRARRAEELGYSALHVADHYIGPGPALDPTGHRPQTVASIPAMAVAAEATTTLRIGSRMLCSGYHQPVVLAKEAATLDFFSGGRLELGLGAGWLESEFDAMGIRFPSPGERISSLREIVQVVLACFGEGQVEVQGTYVSAHGFEGLPKPVQSPRPPLMIGGGAPRILKMAGELADIVSINFNNRSGQVGADSVGTSGADETAKKVAWVREGAGERADRIELEIAAYFISVTGRSETSADEVAARVGMPTEAINSFPHALVGDVGEICEELQRRRDVYGISYVTVGDSHLETFAPVVEKLTGS